MSDTSARAEVLEAGGRRAACAVRLMAWAICLAIILPPAPEARDAGFSRHSSTRNALHAGARILSRRGRVVLVLGGERKRRSIAGTLLEPLPAEVSTGKAAYCTIRLRPGVEARLESGTTLRIPASRINVPTVKAADILKGKATVENAGVMDRREALMIRTPHMLIGVMRRCCFSVDVNAARTCISVLRGEVTVAPRRSPSRRRTMGAGGSLCAYPDGLRPPRPSRRRGASQAGDAPAPRRLTAPEARSTVRPAAEATAGGASAALSTIVSQLEQALKERTETMNYLERLDGELGDDLRRGRLPDDIAEEVRREITARKVKDESIERRIRTLREEFRKAGKEWNPDEGTRKRIENLLACNAALHARITALADSLRKGASSTKNNVPPREGSKSSGSGSGTAVDPKERIDGMLDELDKLAEDLRAWNTVSLTGKVGLRRRYTTITARIDECSLSKRQRGRYAKLKARCEKLMRVRK